MSEYTLKFKKQLHQATYVVGSLLTLFFLLWLVPVRMTYGHLARPNDVYRLKDKNYLSISESYWEWNTNFLSYGLGVVTLNLIGGLSGPESKNYKLIYRLGCSQPEIVLRAPGSVGEMFIYKGKICFANSEYYWSSQNRKRKRISKLYSWDGNRFVSEPTNIPTEEWLKRAEEVFTMDLLKSNKDLKWTLDICENEVFLKESEFADRVTIVRGEAEETLFRARPDSLKIGW